MPTGRTIRIIGAGRAGGSFATALRGAGWSVQLVAHDQLAGETAGESTASLPGPGEAGLSDLRGVEILLLCVPDGVVAEVAKLVPATESVVVAHCSGSLGLDVLDPAPRRASIHPLVPLADPDSGASLLQGAYFAVAGDPLGSELVDALAGTPISVPEASRVLHHAAAVIASNHVVALLAQVENIARTIGVEPEAYLQLTRLAVENVAELGAAAALTGPVSRGDWETVRRHFEALPSEEREAYLALARRAAVLSGRSFQEP